MAGSGARHLSKATVVGLLLLAGCGTQRADELGEDVPAMTTGTSGGDVVAYSVSIPYTLEIGGDPLCSDVAIAGVRMGYSCTIPDINAQLISGKSVGPERVDIYLLPADAIDVGLSPPAAFDLQGPYLIIQTSQSGYLPVLTYSADNLRISCDLSGLIPSCSHQSE